MRDSSSSSRANLRFVPFGGGEVGLVGSVWCWSCWEMLFSSRLSLLVPLAAAAGMTESPICTASKSSTARTLASSSSRAFWSASSCLRRSASFSRRLISLRWASRFVIAHSRQKRSPWGQQTGSTEGRRQSWQDPKGRKESRVRRVVWEPHRSFSAFLSWEVKTDLGGGMVVVVLAVVGGVAPDIPVS